MPCILLLQGIRKKNKIRLKNNRLKQSLLFFLRVGGFDYER